MRFDIVLNNLGLAWTIKEIKMTSDGTPWRPLVHVLDICRGNCVYSSSFIVQIFNVGDTAHNYQVKKLPK